MYMRIDFCCVVIDVSLRTVVLKSLQLATRMAVHGTLVSFDPKVEDWVEYILTDFHITSQPMV